MRTASSPLVLGLMQVVIGCRILLPNSFDVPVRIPATQKLFVSGNSSAWHPVQLLISILINNG